MINGAIKAGRLNPVIHRLAFGAYDQKAGAAGSVIDIFEEKAFNHYVLYNDGLLFEQCAKIIRNLFKERHF